MLNLFVFDELLRLRWSDLERVMRRVASSNDEFVCTC